MIQTRVLRGAALSDALDDVAALRIAVFRSYPYLYDGDTAYERRYLQAYRDSDDAIVVGAYDGTRLIGASTGAPMEDHADDFGLAFAEQGIPLTEIFYCAESVLLPDYRGQGVGHAFFDAREAHARALGRRYSAFCGVVRANDHPERPSGYTPLNGFWRKRGYAPLPGAVAHFSWKEIAQPQESDHTLQFWMRAL